ncbi:MAG: SIS domain-containing protein [Candidatus Ratteibacteria bacterium]|nr:SIS domain-containing protein [Candidatus Ratteibacteria bacterium]
MDFLQIKNKVLESVNCALDKVGETDVFVDAIISANKVFVVGSGRSKLIIESFAQRLKHLGLDVNIVGEILQPPASKADLLIVASGSGESVFPVSIAQKAKKIGMKIVLITAERNSSIGKISDLIICIPASSKAAYPKKITGFQPLGSLFEQCLLIFCDIAAIIIQKTKNIPSETLFENHANLE